MKKIYLSALLVAFFSQVNAQVLNQSAAWPNAAWTITGDYSTDPLAFESNPTTTANFAFDDDDAGNGGHEDNIAAESPVIDLTAAFNAGEKALRISVEYSYFYLDYDVLQFEYWDAATATWQPWAGVKLAGTDTTVTDNFCSAPKVAYNTAELNIAGFNATQLSGFKYRISYDDDPEGADWNYGFCFNSPTIMSVSCVAPIDGVATVTSATTADLSWTSGGATNVEVFIGAAGLGVPADANDTGVNATGTTYAAIGLTGQTDYEFYVRSECTDGTEFSAWSGPYAFNTTVVPGCSTPITPADGAIDVPVGDITFEWTAPTTGDPATSYDMYYGTAANDVTSFVGNFTETSALITITGFDLTLYWRIVPINAGGEATGCDGTVWSFTTVAPPPAPANDECADAIALTPAGNFALGAIPSTNFGATYTETDAPSCQGNVDSSVWYSVVVPASGTLTIETQTIDDTTLTDTVIVAYSGTCGALTAIGCDDDGGPDGPNSLFSILSLTDLTPGETLYISVLRYGNSGGAAGDFQLAAYDPSLLAVNNFDNAAFTAYPNPVKDVLNLSYNKNITGVAVYNLLGQQVLVKSLDDKNAKVDMSGLNQGTYLVKVTSDSQITTLKVVKQ